MLISPEALRKCNIWLGETPPPLLYCFYWILLHRRLHNCNCEQKTHLFMRWISRSCVFRSYMWIVFVQAKFEFKFENDLELHGAIFVLHWGHDCGLSQTVLLVKNRKAQWESDRSMKRLFVGQQEFSAARWESWLNRWKVTILLSFHPLPQQCWPLIPLVFVMHPSISIRTSASLSHL